MAKEDFCFTYYDGDAARDKAHMTRLCRGAYDDLISMQRKVGRMTMTQIKMVLSSDFETCWPSIEFIIKNDGDKYFIEWVENSVSNMRKSAKKQSETAKKRWEKEKQENTTALKKDTTALKNNSLGVPLENEIGNENENENLKEGSGENILPLGYRMSQEFQQKNPEYPQRPSHDMPAILTIGEFIHQQLSGIHKNLFELDIGQQKNIFDQWQKWCEWYQVNGNNKSLETLVKFKLQEIYLEIKNGNKNGTKTNFRSNQPRGRELTSTAIIESDKGFNTIL